MKLLFLGTGAADWQLKDFVDGHEFRRCSSALIDGELLIDPGPHIYHYAATVGDEHLFDHVNRIIVTHTHSDHFNADTVERLCIGRECTLYGDAACMRSLKKSLGDEKAAQIPFVETKLGQDYELGDYKITPLHGNHSTEDPDEMTRVYLVEKEGRILFYGCDSGWITNTAWEVMRDRPINAMILECTCGQVVPNDWRSFGHNTLEMLDLMLKVFRQYHYFADDVKYYTSHMSRGLHRDHETLKAFLAPWNVTPAYDGMQIEI